MPLPALSEEVLRRAVTSQSFERGEQYYVHGSVRAAVRRGMTLEAQVEGSHYTPYRVVITLDGAGIRSSSCTCPYDYGGYCKHQIAVLLTFIRQPEAFVEQPELSDPFDGLSGDQLHSLLRTLLDQKPDMKDWFQVMIASVKTAPKVDSSLVLRTPVDTTAFRRQVQRAVDRFDYNRHWESIWEVVGALDDAHTQAKTFLQGGDFDNGLALVRIIGEEVILKYGELEEECQVADFLRTWADDLTEAILGAELSLDERRLFSQQLTQWADELSDYGLDETLDKPIAACERGWDAPPDDLDELDYEFVVDLTEAQLNVLERRSDTEAYLKLCLERHAHYRYARRLAEFGRIEDAIGHALQHSMDASEYLKLAQFLREQGHVDAAYQIGIQGLSGIGRKYELGQWMAEFAEALGRTDAAQQAWRSAFDSSPSLEAYRHLKRLSAEWAVLRPQLMQQLHQDAYRPVLIEVLIEDQAIEDAIQVWENYPYWGHELLGRLVDAASESHPNWAIQQALAEANGLISKGSKYYPYAVRWLGKVKQIYVGNDRLDDWRACITAVRAEHGRKYSLMGLIKNL